ncbi:MAG: FAD binding domain-containing protein [Hyphomicrobiaceae bacterium]
MTYLRPRTLEHALKELARSRWRILAGGTDFFPELHDRPVDGPVLDISGLCNLKVIREETEYWRIGAMATWSELIASDLPCAFDGLKLAASQIGSIQIQNQATVVGNICNASPAADGVPPLLTLDAKVELASTRGVRRVDLSEFVVDNRSTVREGDELVTGILVPKLSAKGAASFLKLGARRYLVISIVMVACRLVTDDAKRIVEVALSVGACSAVAKRLWDLEAHLAGLTLHEGTIPPIDMSLLDGLQPISDVRSTASGRLLAARELLVRALLAAAEEGSE